MVGEASCWKQLGSCIILARVLGAGLWKWNWTWNSRGSIHIWRACLAYDFNQALWWSYWTSAEKETSYSFKRRINKQRVKDDHHELDICTGNGLVAFHSDMECTHIFLLLMLYQWYTQFTQASGLMFCSIQSRFFDTKPSDTPMLKCNTEKDKQRTKHHTAGILYWANSFTNQIHSCYTFIYIYRYIYDSVGIVVGAWPCGTVTMVGELYGAESKSQVYGSIHTFLQENHPAAENLGKY